MEKRLAVREPGLLPEDELDHLDDEEIASLQRANDHLDGIDDADLTPEGLAAVKGYRKAHGIT